MGNKESYENWLELLRDKVKRGLKVPVLIKSDRAPGLIRAVEEERLRNKVIPRFFDEKSCLKLVFATLLGVSERWQRIRTSPFELAQIYRLQRELGLLPPGRKEKSSRAKERTRRAP